MSACARASSSQCGTEVEVERVVNIKSWARDHGDGYIHSATENSKFNPASQIILKLYFFKVKR